MIDLSLHIEYLLRYHDCVILPGIGAFLQMRKEAAMNPVTGELTPSTSQVCFNQSISNDDALLANSISRREGISFTEARTALAETTRDLLSSLESDRELCFPRIGTLSLNEDDILTFQPAVSFLSAGAIKSILPADTPVAEETTEEASKKFYTLQISRKFVHSAMRYAAMLAFIIISCVTLSDPGAGPRNSGIRTDHASVIPLPSHLQEQTDSVSLPQTVEDLR